MTESELFTRVDAKLARLNTFRPLPPVVLSRLQEQMQLDMTFNSTGIEGNSLTLRETFLVVSDGLTIAGKPLKDHLEVTDHSHALKYLYELVDQSIPFTFSSHFIRSLHSLVMHSTDMQYAGKFREMNVRISGSQHTPPDALDVAALMEQYIGWVREHYTSMHTIELAAKLHHKLVNIHPFADGNGRTARLVMNLVLMRAGYPLTVILKNDRKRYYSVLEEAHRGKYKPFVQFVGRAVERSLDMYLWSVQTDPKKKEKMLTLRELAETSSYSAKYLNLLARKGDLEAHKEGRNWLSSKEALQRYINNRKRKR